MTNLRSIRGRAYPRYRGLLREKSWVMFEILLPFLSTSAFVFVYRSLHAPEAYVGFVVLVASQDPRHERTLRVAHGLVLGDAALVDEGPDEMPRLENARRIEAVHRLAPDQHPGRGLRLRDQRDRAELISLVAPGQRHPHHDGMR